MHFFSESEVIWQAVLAERLRRKCINSVVVYCNRASGKDHTDLTNKVTDGMESDRLLRVIPEVPNRAKTKRPLSPVTSEKVLVLPVPGQNGTRPLLHIANTPSVVLLQNGVKRMAADKDWTDGPESPVAEEEKPRWSGIEEIMEAYQRYSQGLYVQYFLKFYYSMSFLK